MNFREYLNEAKMAASKLKDIAGDAVYSKYRQQYFNNPKQLTVKKSKNTPDEGNVNWEVIVTETHGNKIRYEVVMDKETGKISALAKM